MLKRSLCSLLLGCSIAAVTLAPISLAAEGNPDAEAIALAYEMYSERVQSHHVRHETSEGCGTEAAHRLTKLLEKSSADTRRSVKIIRARAKPVFEGNIETANFIFNYTTMSANPADNVDPADVETMSKEFETVYKRYVKLFKKLDPGRGQKKRVDIFQLPNNFLGLTYPGELMELNSSVLATPCNRKRIVVHEIFHMVQFGHDLLREPSFAQQNWWIEGLAVWTTQYFVKKDSEYAIRAAVALDAPNIPLRNRTGYDFGHFWVWLVNRYKLLNLPGEPTDIIAQLLVRYKKGDAMIDALGKVAKSLLAKEAKSNNRKVYGFAPQGDPIDKLFMGWHLANYLKDRKAQDPRFSYPNLNPRKNDCDEAFKLNEVALVDDVFLEPKKSYNVEASTELGAANYYRFTLASDLTEVKVSLRTRGLSQVRLGLVVFKNEKVKGSKFKEGADMDVAFKFKSGTYDQMLLIVSGGDAVGPNNYRLIVNKPSLDGIWNDGSTSRKMQLKENPDGTIDAKFRGEDSGTINFKGMRTGETAVFTYQDRDDPSILTRFRFEICGSGDTLLGLIDDGMNNDPGEARWCRFTGKLFETAPCLPDPTCVGRI